MHVLTVREFKCHNKFGLAAFFPGFLAFAHSDAESKPVSISSHSTSTLEAAADKDKSIYK